MTKAPKEIFLHPDDPDFSCVNGGGKIKYTRTDTIPTWSTDMDAAPKDGTDILVIAENGAAVAFWDSEYGEWETDWARSGCGHTVEEPTHWRHIDLPQTKETK